MKLIRYQIAEETKERQQIPIRMHLIVNAQARKHQSILKLTKPANFLLFVSLRLDGFDRLQPY
jgi:hypothetical protein